MQDKNQVFRVFSKFNLSLTLIETAVNNSYIFQNGISNASL